MSGMSQEEYDRECRDNSEQLLFEKLDKIIELLTKIQGRW